jgi:DNA end-binding protein Ku
MPRAIWSGSLSFGLVNVPVRLFGATAAKDVHFHQLDEKSGDRIRYRKVSERSSREVPSERIVKGYEVRKGRYVTLTDEDFEAVEPERSHTIDVEDFVALADIDPIHYLRSYWLVPDKSKGATKAYALLRDAMEDSERVAIGRFVLRTKPHLVAIRPAQRGLLLHTMLFPDEVVAAKDVEGLPARAKTSPREVKAARQLIDSLTTTWDPSRYQDTYRESLLDLIRRKSKGEEIVVAEPAEKKAEVVDLMAALEESVRQAGKRRRPAKGRSRKSA